MSGCRRALPRWRNSTQAATPRWKSVSSRSNRFVSGAALALIAGCHSTPRQHAPRPPQAAVQAPAPAAAPVPAATASAAPGVAATGAAATTAAAAAAKAAAANAAPVPERAAQQYSQALNLMKTGRSADAELEFKQ